MSLVTESIDIKAPIGRVFEVIAAFEKYPDFQRDVEEVQIEKRKAKTVQVRFGTNIVKRVDYTLLFVLHPPHRIEWNLVDGGDIMTKNSGEWELENIGKGVVRAAFSSDIKFAFWIPSSITDGIIKLHLPLMLENIKKRVECKRPRKSNK